MFNKVLVPLDDSEAAPGILPYVSFLAIGAAIFGFTGIAGFSANIAWVMLAIYVVLFVLSLFLGLVRGERSHSHR